MTEKTRCPKCGAEKSYYQESDLTFWACGSVKRIDGTFTHTRTCKRRMWKRRAEKEIVRLREVFREFRESLGRTSRPMRTGSSKPNE